MKQNEFDFSEHPITTMIREIIEKICSQCVSMVHDPQFWITISKDSD